MIRIAEVSYTEQPTFVCQSVSIARERCTGVFIAESKQRLVVATPTSRHCRIPDLARIPAVTVLASVAMKIFIQSSILGTLNRINYEL